VLFPIIPQPAAIPRVLSITLFDVMIPFEVAPRLRT
jgi:hypothetical protein